MTPELLVDARLAGPSGDPRPGWLRVEGERIAALGTGDPPAADGARVRELGGRVLAPGFIDLHVHGAAGAEFLGAGPDELTAILRMHARGGTTGLLATTVTAAAEPLEAGVRALASAGPVPGGAAILGIHLEGPYLCAKRRGAQDERYLRPPDAAELDRLLAAGPVRLITLAPELPGALDAIARLVGDGVVVSVGHTDATHAEAAAAFDAGARHATHLFNGMRPLHHREPGVIGAALDRPEVTCELICDGLHVDPVVMRLAQRLKGAEGTVLVTDAMAAAGLGDGAYRLGELPVRVRDGRVELDDGSGTLAGSTLTMGAAVRNAVRLVGVPLGEALRMASATPARLLGMEDRKGALAAGHDADLVVLDDDLQVAAAMVAGAWTGEASA
jgi:N-acetylglucosamine-6-phosphate deacetylase